MTAWLFLIPFLLGLGLYTFRAGRLFWVGGTIRGAVGTWVLGVATMVVPVWFLWRGH